MESFSQPQYWLFEILFCFIILSVLGLALHLCYLYVQGGCSTSRYPIETVGGEERRDEET